ncbi:MAG: hypothetical protein NZ895_06195 [Archaeoglobaceae archaeon]|nr:hypothetical protein [Archaeoglobaceae archaeon]MCX8151477.1 hypothetical protein [Archaeoglobaceae archaeon]MDW8014239.1 hypothetical protein [Archaeoglobaceae archaeon]
MIPLLSLSSTVSSVASANIEDASLIAYSKITIKNTGIAAISRNRTACRAILKK